MRHMRLDDRQRALHIAGLDAVGARRAALTALFQSGVTLAEFLRELVAERPGITQVAAAAQLAAVGGINAVVHAEHCVSAYRAK